MQHNIRITRRSGAEAQVNLSKPRRWFADEGEAGTSSAGTQNTGHMIPKARLDEVLEQKRQLEQTLAKFQEEASAREQARLQEEGRWKELAEQRGKDLAALQPFQERAENLETAIKAANEKLIAQVPESMRKLIPVDYPPERLQMFLNDNWSLLTVKPAPDIDAGAGAGSGGKSITLTAEQREMAARMGISPEVYAKRLQERG